MANPYHDKEGKFTSKGNQGRAEPKLENKISKIKLKAGVDLSNFPIPKNINLVNQVSKGVIDTTFELTLPKSIDEANAQGNKILGSNVVVKYANDTNLEQAFEMNKGLKAVVSEFPNLFTDNILLSYGTGTREDKRFFTFQENKDIIENIFKRQEYQDLRDRLAKGGINLEDIKNNFINNVALTNNIKKFNFGSKRNQGVGGVTKSVGSKMTGIRTPDAVEINPIYMAKDLQMSIKKMQPHVNDGGFLPWGDKTPTFATATHELGHHCYNQLQNFMNSEERQKLFDLTYQKNKLHLIGEISGYAATDKEELIAEAFSDYFCRGDNATKHNQKVVNLLKGVYNRIYGIKKV